jgi:hypothetical protein
VIRYEYDARAMGSSRALASGSSSPRNGKVGRGREATGKAPLTALSNVEPALSVAYHSLIMRVGDVSNLHIFQVISATRLGVRSIRRTAWKVGSRATHVAVVRKEGLADGHVFALGERVEPLG